MNALVLGGMSSRHKVWVRHVTEALKPHFTEVVFLDYRHWDVEGGQIDIEYEIDQAAMLAKDLGDYVVVAKSIGTAIATLAAARGQLAPKRCLFMGFPLKVVQEDMPEVAVALSKLPKTTFLHNAHDPLGIGEDVGTYLQINVAPRQYTLMILPGDTHDYVDLDQIVRLSVKDLGEQLEHPYYQPY